MDRSNKFVSLACAPICLRPRAFVPAPRLSHWTGVAAGSCPSPRFQHRPWSWIEVPHEFGIVGALQKCLESAPGLQACGSEATPHRQTMQGRTSERPKDRVSAAAGTGLASDELRTFTFTTAYSPTRFRISASKEDRHD